MNQFIFETKKTWDDYGLSLSSYEIGSPEPVTYYISILGVSGSLDLSESLSDAPVYRDRAFSALFTLLPLRFQWVEKHSVLSAAIHGRKLKIWEPDDLDHYYVGRLSVGALQRDGAVAILELTGTLDPYKYKNSVTSVTVASTATEQSVMLLNADMPVTPVITTDAPIQITYGSSIFAVNAGTHRLAIVLTKGQNEVKVKGAATVTFDYQEGVL